MLPNLLRSLKKRERKGRSCIPKRVSQAFLKTIYGIIIGSSKIDKSYEIGPRCRTQDVAVYVADP